MFVTILIKKNVLSNNKKFLWDLHNVDLHIRINKLGVKVMTSDKNIFMCMKSAS